MDESDLQEHIEFLKQENAELRDRQAWATREAYLKGENAGMARAVKIMAERTAAKPFNGEVS